MWKFYHQGDTTFQWSPLNTLFTQRSIFGYGPARPRYPQLWGSCSKTFLFHCPFNPLVHSYTPSNNSAKRTSFQRSQKYFRKIEKRKKRVACLQRCAGRGAHQNSIKDKLFFLNFDFFFFCLFFPFLYLLQSVPLIWRCSRWNPTPNGLNLGPMNLD